MSYQLVSCKLGETLGIRVHPKDCNGVALELDEDWAVAVSFRTVDGGSGSAFHTPTLVIADGIATCDIDTGASPWVVGTYYYDVRITDPDGHDYWSQTIQLRLVGRQTAPST